MADQYSEFLYETRLESESGFMGHFAIEELLGLAKTIQVTGMTRSLSMYVNPKGSMESMNIPSIESMDQNYGPKHSKSHAAIEGVMLRALDTLKATFERTKILVKRLRDSIGIRFRSYPSMERRLSELSSQIQGKVFSTEKAAILSVRALDANKFELCAATSLRIYDELLKMVSHPLPQNMTDFDTWLDRVNVHREKLRELDAMKFTKASLQTHGYGIGSFHKLHTEITRFMAYDRSKGTILAKEMDRIIEKINHMLEAGSRQTIGTKTTVGSDGRPQFGIDVNTSYVSEAHYIDRAADILLSTLFHYDAIAYHKVIRGAEHTMRALAACYV